MTRFKSHGSTVLVSSFFRPVVWPRGNTLQKKSEDGYAFNRRIVSRLNMQSVTCNYLYMEKELPAPLNLVCSV